MARHLDVAYYGRKVDELREHLRNQWPSSVTDGGAVSFPAILLHVFAMTEHSHRLDRGHVVVAGTNRCHGPHVIPRRI